MKAPIDRDPRSRTFAAARGLAVLVICLGAVLGGAASPARADSLTQLPFSNVSKIAVDPAGQHVFLSGGSGQSSIVVLDFSGAIVKTITGEPGASQMAVDATTHTLYVALHDANAISEIDTQTLTETSRFSLQPYVNPVSVVIAGGKLWFSCDTVGGYCIGSANLDGTGVAGQITGMWRPVLLSAGGANNDLLATANYGGEPAAIQLYDVSSGSATPLQGPIGDPGGACGASLGDFTVEPSGDYVLFAGPCDWHAAALATDLLGSSYDYPTGYGPDAVAASPDGQYVAVATNSSINPIGVAVFATGSSQPSWAWTTAVDPHGLAFSPDGTKVFAIVGDNGGLGFQVLDRYTSSDAEITSGPTTTYSSSSSFSFSSHTANATFQCNLDDGGWGACTSPATEEPVPSPGSHTFEVRSVSSAGQIAMTGASKTWTILAPDTMLTGGQSGSSYSPNATFAFTSHDPKAIFTCKLDGAAIWTQCYSPTTYSNLASGSHTFRVKAQDGDVASDVDPVGASKTWTVAAGGHPLDVTATGKGLGAVTSSPQGMNCSSGSDCTVWYAGGTTVTLTATPSAGSGFAGWSGGCRGTGKCVVTLSQARAVTATFVLVGGSTLTVSKAGRGTVSSRPAGISCGSTCSHSYRNGTLVTLTATAASGSVFTGWSGACTGTSTKCQVSITTTARSTTATFARTKLLKVVKAGTGSGKITSSPAGISCRTSCTHAYAAGTVVTLTAAPKSGSSFTGWSGACSGTGNCTVTMSAAKKVKARFALHATVHRTG